MQQTTVNGTESTFDRVRRPEYTGENRCLPCTVTNAAIGGLLTAGAFVLSPWFAVGVGLASAAAIYLRGYLVPGTPELTRRYFPDRVLRLFDGDRTRFVPESFRVERLLVEAGAVVPGDEDLELDDAFETEWYERMAALTATEASQRQALATIVGLDADGIRLDAGPVRFVARYDGEWLGQWESRAAFVADAGASTLLADRLDAWESMPVAYRSELLASLRLFVERCPTCEGSVRFGTDVVESCCRSYDVVAATCEDCDARLFEAPYDETVHAVNP